MHYEQEEIYPDSDKVYKKEQNKSDESSEGENEIVNSCVKVITEETDHSSNNPNSSRFTLHQPDFYQSYEYNYYGESRSKRTVGSDENSIFQINLETVEKDGRTTIMLRNIPNKYTRDMILEEIDGLNFKKKYDFFYLPIDYRVPLI